MLTSCNGRWVVAILLAGIFPLMTPLAREGAAQDISARVAISALGAIKPVLGDGSVAVDVSSLCKARLAQWSCPGPAREMLSRLQMVPSSRAFTHVCPEGPQSCRLIGVRHLVVPGAARINRRSAQIPIEVISDSGGGGGLLTQRYEVHLVRRRDEWRVVRIDSGR